MWEGFLLFLWAHPIVCCLIFAYISAGFIQQLTTRETYGKSLLVQAMVFFPLYVAFVISMRDYLHLCYIILHAIFLIFLSSGRGDIWLRLHFLPVLALSIPVLVAFVLSISTRCCNDVRFNVNTHSVSFDSQWRSIANLSTSLDTTMSYFLSALQDDPHVIYQSRHIHDSVFTFYQQEWPFQDASSSAYLDSVYGFQSKPRGAQGDSKSLPFQTVFKPRFANLTNTMKALAESLRYGPEQHSRALAAFDRPNILLGFINMRKLDPIPSDWPWIGQLRSTLQLGYINKLARVHTKVLTSESQRLRGILLLIDDLKRQMRECEIDLKNIVSLGPPPGNWESSPSEREGHDEYRILHRGYVIWWHELMPFMEEKIHAWSRFSRKPPSRRGPAVFGEAPRLMLRNLVMLGEERRSVDKWELWEKKTMVAWASIESVRLIVKGQLENVDKGLDVLKGVRSGLDWRLDKRLGNKCRDC